MSRGDALTEFVEKASEAECEAALRAAGVPRLAARILAARGIGADALDDFLHPSLSGLARPDELPGLAAAADCLLAAVRENREIVVFGDYDCDGVCATALMVRALGILGARVSGFIPKRLDEGYGMNAASIARLLGEHPDVGLVLTVDNGITACDQVAELTARGIRVVVTDHHLPEIRRVAEGRDEVVLPPAEVVVDPKVAAPAALADLCGAGVAFFLAARLFDAARARGLYDGRKVGGPLLVLAGLATVTDIMPLTGQNRLIVAEALRRFDALAPTGLRQLFLKAAKTGAKRYTSRDFGFLLGPRVNAAGRVGDSRKAFELLMSDDPDAANKLAIQIEQWNLQRKEVENLLTEAAKEQVVPGASAQVIAVESDDPCAAGVVGIVAARVLEQERENPQSRTLAVCITVGGRGSARALPGVNIRDALAESGEFLERFGGHAAAAGFSVREGKIEEFRAALCRICDRIRDLTPVPAHMEVDAVAESGELTLELAEWFQKFEPFGEGNEEPHLALRRVMLKDVQPMGASGAHLQLTFADPRLPRAVWWRHGGEIERLRAAARGPFDVKFTLEISDYGERHAELRVLSVKPCTD